MKYEFNCFLVLEFNGVFRIIVNERKCTQIIKKHVKSQRCPSTKPVETAWAKSSVYRAPRSAHSFSQRQLYILMLLYILSQNNGYCKCSVVYATKTRN